MQNHQLVNKRKFKKRLKKQKIHYPSLFFCLVILFGIFYFSTFVFIKAKQVFFETPSVKVIEPSETLANDLTAPPLEAVKKRDYSNADAALLYALSENYPNAEVIADHYSQIPDQLVKLALKNNETIDFVADYLNYDFETEEPIDISGEVSIGTIPHFLQWDSRWGFLQYGQTADMLSISGCGPTSLSMVVAALTGDMSANPKEIADFSFSKGYYDSENGTSWAFMKACADKYSIYCKEVNLSSENIKSALNNGQYIIASMKPGDFTDGGHFIVLKGVSEDGKILVNDPNSIIKSQQLWDIDILMKQMRNLWAFSV